MKLNITPGPWRYSPKTFNTENRENVATGSIVNETWYIVEVQNSCGHHKLEDQTESEANAEAIITAVNNTYHKGINPEAVPEMLEIAKEVREWYEKNHAELLDQRTPICFSKLLSVIQKATL